MPHFKLLFQLIESRRRHCMHCMLTSNMIRLAEFLSVIPQSSGIVHAAIAYEIRDGRRSSPEAWAIVLVFPFCDQQAEETIERCSCSALETELLANGMWGAIFGIGTRRRFRMFFTPRRSTGLHCSSCEPR
jgi:hypothetical protein